jgi:hypothetical protein
VGLFSRTPKLPANRRPALARDERVLAWAAVSAATASGAGRAAGGPAGADREADAPAGDDAGVVVATNLGLWLPGEAERLGWHQIHKAAWDGQRLAVTTAEVVGERDGYRIVADQPVRHFRLADPGELPHQIRARVTRSVAYTQHYAGGGGGVRVAARRVPGVDGLTWTVRFDAGMPPPDEVILAETDRLVEESRATLNVEP